MKPEYRKLLEQADRDTLLGVLLEIDRVNEGLDYDEVVNIDDVVERLVSGTPCDHPLSPNFWERMELFPPCPTHPKLDMVSDVKTRELVRKVAAEMVAGKFKGLLP